MWTDEASGAYIWYVSIAEEGTSSRARLNAKKLERTNSSLLFMVGVRRFELPAPWSQTTCATKLRYTPPKYYLSIITF